MASMDLRGWSRRNDIPSEHQGIANQMIELLSQQLKRTDVEGDVIREAWKQWKYPYHSESRLEVEMIHPLIQKVAAGDSKCVRALLDHNVDVNVRGGEFRDTPLIVACKSKSLEMVDILLSYEADMNISDKNRNTPLMIAIENKSEEIAQKLLSCGANVHLTNNDRETALHTAARAGCNNIIPQILEKGVDVHCRDLKQKTPLMWSCHKAHPDTAQLLINHGADIEAEDVYGYSALHIAVWEGHGLVVEVLTKANANVNHEEKFGVTPVILASINNNMNIVRELVNHGANVNHGNKLGDTALLYACINQCEELATYLLSPEVNADPNVCNVENSTPLIWSCMTGNFTITKCLIERGANPLLGSNNGMTAFQLAVQLRHTSVVRLILECDRTLPQPQTKLSQLHVACAGSNTGLIRKLLNSGADAERRDKDGKTPLMICAVRGNSDAVDEFLTVGAKVNASDCEGNTPLMAAVESGEIKTVQILLNHGADVNISNTKGKTALMLTAKHGDVKIIELLLSKDANINAQDVGGWTTLMMVSQHGHIQAVQLLLEKGAHVTMKAFESETALSISSGFGHQDLAELLLQAQMSQKHPEENGWTPLHFAASKGLDKLAKHLIRNNAVVDATDVKGVNPVMLSCEYGHDEMVRLLYDNGADINKVSSDGHTPVYKAVVGGHYKVLAKLTNRGANVHCVDQDKRTPLIIAALRGNSPLMLLLLKSDLDIDKPDGNGWTPLMLCSQFGYTDCISKLLEHGASVNLKNSTGSTALHICAGNGHMAAVKKLLESGADPCLTDCDGNTAMMLSAQHKHLDVGELLCLGKDGNIGKEKKEETESGGAEGGCPEDLTLLEDIDGFSHEELIELHGFAKLVIQPSSVAPSKLKDQGYGDLEFEVLGVGELEAEPSLAKKKCDKYPGHKEFISISEFTLKHLPDRLQSQEIFKYIQAAADLTVRLSVKISVDRPPDDPFAPHAGCRIAGSAVIFSVEALDKDCHCEDCETYGHKNRKWWCLSLYSATHCIADKSEAENTRVDFFYDSDSCMKAGKVKSLYGVRMTSAYTKRDTCSMTCATHDDELGNYLSQRYKEISKVDHQPLVTAPGGGTTSDKEVMLCISHPHGSPKHVTIGELVHRNDVPCTQSVQKITDLMLKVDGVSLQYSDYTTPTCRGSSGSVVICLDRLTSDNVSERYSAIGIHLMGKRSTGVNTGFTAKVDSFHRYIESQRHTTSIHGEDMEIWKTNVIRQPVWKDI